MNETSRTGTFVAVAAVSVVLAWFFRPVVDITPEKLANAKLGQPFFPEFSDPNEATSIRVITFDESRAASRPFGVEFKNGLWTIPSHHDYPADGKDRLAKTATSAMGIKRDELRSVSKDDHEELGVVDPLDQDSSRLKGRGQRITLSKGDTVLADFIIGKQVRDRQGFYYIRVPSEDSTYVAKLDINLSTKFADWVETDLLKLSRDALREVVFDNYSIATDGGRPRVVKGDVSQIDRTGPSDPWKLEGLDEKTEELDNAKVGELVSTLDDLKLVGVRPKPKGINADVTIDRKYVNDQLDLEVLRGDLRARGFEILLDPDDPQQPRLYSRQGESSVGTSDGVVYQLRFGEVFSGDESEIEIGGKADSKAEDKKPGEGEDEEKSKATGKQSSRYLFVSTKFDEKFLGPRPVEPERPAGLPEEPKKEEEEEDAKPAIKPSKAAAKKKVEDCGPPGAPGVADDDQPEADAPESETEKEPDVAPKADEAQPAADAKPDGESAPAESTAPTDSVKTKSLDELKKDYEVLRQKYEADLEAWESKVKAGKEKVEELNLRFGDWYYVISAENFAKLHLTRKDLVKEKAAASGASPGGQQSPPDGKATGDAAGDDKPENEPAPGADATGTEKPGSEKTESEKTESAPEE